MNYFSVYIRVHGTVVHIVLNKLGGLSEAMEIATHMPVQHSFSLSVADYVEPFHSLNGLALHEFTNRPRWATYSRFQSLLVV